MQQWYQLMQLPFIDHDHPVSQSHPTRQVHHDIKWDPSTATNFWPLCMNFGYWTTTATHEALRSTACYSSKPYRQGDNSRQALASCLESPLPLDVLNTTPPSLTPVPDTADSIQDVDLPLFILVEASHLFWQWYTMMMDPWDGINATTMNIPISTRFTWTTKLLWVQ